MPEIVIEQATFERLQRHAKPFVDTPEMVIDRALDALEQTRVEDTPTRQPIEKDPQLNPVKLPDLTHTKVVDASIDGEQIVKPNWNHLLDEMLRRAMGRVDGFDDLVKLFQVNLATGRKEDEGYRYLREIDISVQGQHANGACRAIVTAAQVLEIPLNIGIFWRLKEGATYPGERRRITI